MTLVNNDIYEDTGSGKKLSFPAVHAGTSFTLHNFTF